MTGFSRAGRRSRSPLNGLSQVELQRIGLDFRHARSEKGMTQHALAVRLGVSTSAVSALENGRAVLGADRLVEAARLLDLDLAALAPAGAAVLAGDGQGARHRDDQGAADWREFAPPHLDAPLEGALAAFLEVGYHGATIRDIAARAGLSVPGLYHYYPNKHALLAELLRLTMDDLIARCQAARAEGEGTAERFALLVECLALFHVHRRRLGVIAYSEARSLLPDAREQHLEARRQVQRMVVDEVERGRSEGLFHTPEAHVAARAVVAMCMALPQWFSERGPSPAEEIARQHVGVAFDVVRCPDERRPAAGRRG